MNNKELTRDEMRFLRREMINKCLHLRFTLRLIKIRVRLMELGRYGQELRIY